MTNETESVGITSDQDQAQVISFFPASNKVEEAEFKLLSDTVRTLPAHAVKDLLSIGVCIGCIFRLFGVYERVCSCASLSTSMLCSILEKAIGLEGIKFDNGLIAREGSSSQEPSQLVGTGQGFCRLCMGILQFAYLDDNNLLVQRGSANEFALVIADIVKQGCHQIDSFSLEVSIPPSISGNEEAVGSYMKTNYASEFWFQQLCISELANTKDILKLSITGPLERLLGFKSGSSSFRVRLTYTPRDALTSSQNTMVNKQLNKRRKTGSDDKADANNCSGASGIEGSNFCKGEEYASKKISSNGFQDHRIFGSIKLQLEKVSQPFRLTFLCYRTPIYIGGRYLKYSRNVSQTRWIIDDERMGEASVEEIVGGSILPMCHGDNYKFHAAGREDIDVRMLGSGRPFLIEIQNAHTMPCEASVKDMESKINNLESKLVRVKNLKVLGNQGWNLMREGEAEKQKQYAALVWISRSLHDDDMHAISLCKDMKILQRTPIRVLHRRSPLEREKIIHWMKIEPIAGNSQYFLLHLCTQAGTYIKEFVHGDLGRTHPSIGSILGCRAEIQQLDVTDILQKITRDKLAEESLMLLTDYECLFDETFSNTTQKTSKEMKGFCAGTSCYACHPVSCMN